MSRLELIQALTDIHDTAAIDDREGFNQWREDHKFPESEYRNYHAALVGYIEAVSERAFLGVLGEI